MKENRNKGEERKDREGRQSVVYILTEKQKDKKINGI